MLITGVFPLARYIISNVFVSWDGCLILCEGEKNSTEIFLKSRYQWVKTIVKSWSPVILFSYVCLFIWILGMISNGLTISQKQQQKTFISTKKLNSSYQTRNQSAINRGWGEGERGEQMVTTRPSMWTLDSWASCLDLNIENRWQYFPTQVSSTLQSDLAVRSKQHPVRQAVLWPQDRSHNIW